MTERRRQEIVLRIWIGKRAVSRDGPLDELRSHGLFSDHGRADRRAQGNLWRRPESGARGCANSQIVTI